MDNLSKIIDQKLLDEQDNRSGRKKSDCWTPSSFGRCYRFQFWNRMGKPKEKADARQLRIFKVGNLFHDLLENMLPEHEKEVLIKKDDIFGYADVVLPDRVIDIKSVHSRAFWYMNKPDYDIYESRLPNWLQVATYAWLLDKEWCGLYIISRDDLSVNEYATPTSKWITKVESELNVLRTWWKGKVLPPAAPRAYSGKECKYCPFEKDCKEYENEHKPSVGESAKRESESISEGRRVEVQVASKKRSAKKN